MRIFKVAAVAGLIPLTQALILDITNKGNNPTLDSLQLLTDLRSFDPQCY